MTVCDVIATADNILNLNIISQLDLSSLSLAQAMEQNADCVLLLDCCNGVTEDLFRQFFPDCRTTVAEAVDGVINTSSLNICRAVVLTDSAGCKIPFTCGSDGLKIDRDGKYNLTYARLPEKLNFETEIPFPDCKVTDRVFIYGVIAEYLRVTGDFSRSQSWKEKFERALESAVLSKTNLRMPVRRWLS